MRKKQAVIFIVILIFSVTMSCATVDLGTYNPVKTPKEDLVTLQIDNCCHVVQIDNYKVDTETTSVNKIFVKLNPGVHTFFAKFNDLHSYTTIPMPVTARFEKGNTYFLGYDVNNQKVTYHIFLYNNNKKSKEVTGKPMENLIEMDILYSVFVESPVKRGESVKLENKNCALVYKPDGVYTQTDKESGMTVKGKYLFKNHDNDPNAIFSSVSSAADNFLIKVYLFDANAEIIKRRGVNGSKNEINYSAAHTILVLIDSTENEVIYRYEKPDKLKGTEITFNLQK